MTSLGLDIGYSEGSRQAGKPVCNLEGSVNGLDKQAHNDIGTNQHYHSADSDAGYPVNFLSYCFNDSLKSSHSTHQARQKITHYPLQGVPKLAALNHQL